MYITVSEIPIPQETLVRLTDDEGTGAVNTARAEAAITAAEALIDCSLSRAYSVPFSSPPQMVIEFAKAVTVYNLYLRIGMMPDEVKESFANTSELLEKAARGEVYIGLEPPGPGPGYSYQDREFSREYMEGL